MKTMAPPDIPVVSGDVSVPGGSVTSVIGCASCCAVTAERGSGCGCRGVRQWFLSVVRLLDGRGRIISLTSS